MTLPGQQQHIKTPTTPSISKTMQTLPINLSLSEDERSPNNRSAGSDPMSSPQFNKAMAAGGVGPNSAGANPSGSPLETADMLYEYFPLSLDDW
jgi:hypothetical protein